MPSTYENLASSTSRRAALRRSSYVAWLGFVLALFMPGAGTLLAEEPEDDVRFSSRVAMGVDGAGAKTGCQGALFVWIND